MVRFQAVTLKDIAVNTNWTGATIMCQAALNGGKRTKKEWKCSREAPGPYCVMDAILSFL